jgi:asparagine synthase (glutamine-hydrolysing)
MSGFVGLVNLDQTPVDDTLLSELTDGLAFRSDAKPVCLSMGCAGFGYAPLRTTTARLESAPISTLDGSTYIVADARLDGRAGLIGEFDPEERNRLSKASDSELILHCYRRWGGECAGHLLGDFSFAIWDAARQRLFCARDHLGVKPFFYASQGDRLIAGNTLQCIRGHPDVSDALNDLAIADFLFFGGSKDPSVTVFTAIQRLPAGHTLIFEPGGLTIQRYWHPQWGEPPRYRRSSDYVHHFREVLQEAVADRITSDHTALLMSGGLDSTAVAAAARKTSTRMKAFTVVYDRLIPDQERRYSSEAARYLNLPIDHFAVDDYTLYERAEEIELRTPEPSDGPLTAAFIDHLRNVRRFSSVALSGHGGDVLFAITPELGPHWIRTGRAGRLALGAWQYLWLRGRIPPLGFRGGLKRILGRAPVGDSLEYPAWIHPDLETRFDLRQRWAAHHSARFPERPSILSDPAWPALFESYDPGVTRIPVEIRYPLFDLRVVNYCLALSAIPWCIEKMLLRTAMRGWVPESVRLRPKTPLAADPVAVRLAGSPWVDDWQACPMLARFVQRSSVPPLAGTGIPPYPHLRARSLDIWLRGLTKPLIKGTSRSDGFQQDAAKGTIHHP